MNFNLPRVVFRRAAVFLVIVLLVMVRGWGAASGAEVQYPLSIAVAENGEIYLADRDLHGVWKLQGETLTLFFEGSKNFRTPLNAIRCVAIGAEGKLLAGDSSTREIYRFDANGQPVGLTHRPASGDESAEKDRSAEKDGSPEKPEQPAEVPATERPAAATTAPENARGEKPAGPPEAAPASAESGGKTAAKTSEQESKKVDAAARPAPAPRTKFIHGQIGIPMDIAVARNGDLYVSDLEIHRIVKVSSDGGEVKEFAQVQAPRGLCFDAEDNLWVVSGRRLVRISSSAEKTVVVEDGIFNFPHTVAVAPDKTAYVCDGYEKAIWKVPPGGKPEKLVSGEPMKNPVGMRLAGDQLLVVDPHARSVFRITLDGKLTAIPLKAGG